jgi:hypothetical protein
MLRGVEVADDVLWSYMQVGSRLSSQHAYCVAATLSQPK